jgi:hypothetical protein
MRRKGAQRRRRGNVSHGAPFSGVHLHKCSASKSDARRRASSCRPRRDVRTLLTAVLLLLVSFLSHANDNPPVRDGLPCVRRVCVGDDLIRLLNLPWQPVAEAAAAGASRPAAVPDWLSTFIRAERTTLELLAPYWTRRRFDAARLAVLGRVTAVCQELGFWLRPQASYVNERGHATTVTFEPVPSPDMQTQTFRVATVTRTYSQDTSRDELARVARAIADRYAGLPMYANEAQPAVQWLPRAVDGPTLRLFAPVGDAVQRGIALSRHPACRRPDSGTHGDPDLDPRAE